MNKKQRFIYVASALLSIILFLVGTDRITRFVEGVPAQKVGVSGLQENLKGITIHEGDRWVDGPTSFDKNSLVVLRGYLHSQLNPSQTIEFYRKSTPRSGWEEADIEASVGYKALKFCRGGVSLIIESRDEDRGDYYFRLAWTSDKTSDSYCPKPNVNHSDNLDTKK